MKTEQLLKIKSEENCESGLVEIQSLKVNFEKEVERNESLEAEIKILQSQINDFENTSIETKQQIINWQEKLKESNAEIASHQNQIAIRDQELLEAKNLLRLAKSEISSTEKINSQLMSSIESVRSENSIKSLDSHEKNSELALSKQLIRKLQREIEIYKDFLSKTST